MTSALALLRYWREGLAAILAIALAISIIALKAEKRHSGKLQTQIGKLSAQLEAISTARNEQRQTTDRTIKSAHDGIAAVQATKRRLETAPIPLDCKTPGIEAAREVL